MPTMNISEEIYTESHLLGVNKLGVMEAKMIETAEDREINLTCTDNQEYPVCPWCGHEHRDNYFEFSEGLNECEYCGNEFSVTYVTHYTTEKVSDDSDYQKAKKEGRVTYCK